jgi:hypothetical protein
MLSWICPECGRENDPAFQECPGCTPGLVAPQPVRQQHLGHRDRPSPMPATLTFETDYVTAPCIDPRSLGLSPKTPSPPALARSVDWEVRSQITPARPACRTIVDSVDPVYTESRLDAPASTALTVQMTTALALAPEVEAPTEEFIFRTLALLGKCNPLPPTWCTAMYGPVEGSFVPDHRWVLGMESDLLHLMEALRESPNRVLLDCGKEDGPLPATLAPRALARKQDLECVLEYVPVPRALAPPRAVASCRSLPPMAVRWSIFRWLAGGNGLPAQSKSHRCGTPAAMRFSHRPHVGTGCSGCGCGPTGRLPRREAPEHSDRWHNVPRMFGPRWSCVDSMRTEYSPARW